MEHVTKKGTVDTLEETISALARLDELPAASDKFQKNLFLGILDPVLLPNVDNYSHGVRVEESSIAVDPEPSPASVSDVLGYIARIFSFLRRSLPDSILISLSDSFIPAVSSKIISHWLSSAIPTELDGLDEFEATLNHVLQFTKTIESLGWYGQEELVSWANQAPRLWLMRRRVDSLDQVRQVLAASNWDPRQVERIEKRQVSETDEVLLDNSASDDWDASWDDEKEETASNADEDVSAWGLDDDTDDADDTKATKPDVPDADEDEARDAWGWAEDDEDDQAPAEKVEPKKTIAEPVNGNEAGTRINPKEITLRESYTITDVPDSIIRIIRQQISDSETISKPSYVLVKSTH